MGRVRQQNFLRQSLGECANVKGGAKKRMVITFSAKGDREIVLGEKSAGATM